MPERTDWEERAKGLLRGEMARRGVTYAQLAERLAAIGVDDNERNLRNKVSRGKFTAGFLLQCLTALGCLVIALGLNAGVSSAGPRAIHRSQGNAATRAATTRSASYTAPGRHCRGSGRRPMPASAAKLEADQREKHAPCRPASDLNASNDRRSTTPLSQDGGILVVSDLGGRHRHLPFLARNHRALAWLSEPDVPSDRVHALSVDVAARAGSSGAYVRPVMAWISHTSRQ